MRNLVIGSDGFVGRALCSYLGSLGEDVVPLDIKRGETHDARFAQLPLLGIDRVYFLAWDVGGAKYLYREEVQAQQMEWNLRLLLNVMPQLQKAGCAFLFVSSQLAEECDTVYGVTKRLGEVWSQLLGGARVRLWNIYGAMEQPNERSHVVADFVHQAFLRGRIEMMTSGEEMRQFVYVDDVCRAFHGACGAQLEGVYDVTSFEWVRVVDVARRIAELTDCEVVPGKEAGRTPRTPLLGRLPGWLPEIGLREGLARFVERVRQGMTDR